MVEKMVYDSLDEELMELPIPKRFLQQGLEQGREEGREEGLRHSIMNVLTARFNPNTAFQERFSGYLETQRGLETLDKLFMTVMRAESLEALESLMS